MPEAVKSTVAFTNVMAWADVIASDSAGKPVTTTLSVTQAKISFGENTIPNAVLKLSLGSSVNGKAMKISPSHAAAANLERGNPIIVWAKLNGTKVPNTKWADNSKFRIFEGFISSVQYASSVGSMTLFITVDHWLVDLSNSTRYSSILHASTPTSYFQPIIQGDIAGGTGSIRTDNYNSQNLTASGIAADLSKAIKDYIEGMASKSWMSDELKKALNYPPNYASTNAAALAALKKFDRGKTIPLKLADKYDPIAKAMLGGFLAAAGDVSSGPSFLDFIINLGGTYEFTLLPFITTATLAPVVKAISGAGGVVVRAKDYTNIESIGAVAMLRRNIRAVALLGYGSWNTMCERNETARPTGDNSSVGAFRGFADLYQNNDATAQYANGQIVFMQCPRWLDNNDLITEYTKSTIPFGESLKSGASADGVDGAKQKATDPKEATKLPTRLHIGDALATQQLAEYTLKDRRTSITGRLRFDIAPGTQVKIEVVGKNVPFYKSSAEGKENFLYAYVEGVTINLDSEQGQASTSLQLSHVRTEAENNAKNLTLKTHQFYDQAWTDAPKGLLEGQNITL